MKHVPSW